MAASTAQATGKVTEVILNVLSTADSLHGIYQSCTRDKLLYNARDYPQPPYNTLLTMALPLDHIALSLFKSRDLKDPAQSHRKSER